MDIDPRSPIRIARPSKDLHAAQRFWAEGLGLSVLFRTEEISPGEHHLLMLGWPDAAWHLELVDNPEAAARSTPTGEDLLVVYVGAAIDEELLRRLESCGGRRVPAANPYWDTRGVTIEDPDGYRLVLSNRTWQP